MKLGGKNYNTGKNETMKTNKNEHRRGGRKSKDIDVRGPQTSELKGREDFGVNFEDPSDQGTVDPKGGSGK